MNGTAKSPNAMLAEIGMGYICTKALYAVAKLGVADEIGERGSSVNDLAKAAGTDQNALYRIMRLLAGLGVFREEEDRNFFHTPMSERLRTDHDQSERDRLIFWGEEQYEAFEEIIHSVCTGEPGFERRYKESLFDYLKSDDDVN